MTLPYERTRAVVATEDFLYKLIDNKRTPRLSKQIRDEARSLLKHYPAAHEMNLIANREDNTNSIIKVFGNGIS